MSFHVKLQYLSMTLSENLLYACKLSDTSWFPIEQLCENPSGLVSEVCACGSEWQERETRGRLRFSLNLVSKTSLLTKRSFENPQAAALQKPPLWAGQEREAASLEKNVGGSFCLKEWTIIQYKDYTGIKTDWAHLEEVSLCLSFLEWEAGWASCPGAAVAISYGKGRTSRKLAKEEGLSKLCTHLPCSPHPIPGPGFSCHLCHSL